jgi:6-phosphogluconolactonase (cycloisomerase 2 family)
MTEQHAPAVFVQTNDAERNEIVAFAAGDDGRLTALVPVATGGRGTGEAHLPSQGSLAVTADGRFLLVANAGSDDVSVLAIEAGGLRLAGRAGSGGRTPVSIAVHGPVVYVANRSGGILGFTLSDEGALAAIPGSARSLSRPDADPAQIGFSPDGRQLVVTERNHDALAVYTVDGSGLATGPASFPTAGATPYGFDFTPDGGLVVTEAFGGAVGAAAASSYRFADERVEPVSRSVPDTRSEVCWAVTSKDGRSVWVTNFGDGTISRYAVGADGSIELADAVAAATVEGEPGVRDAARTADGRFLYALDADARRVFGWRVAADGALEPAGSSDGLPATAAGLAAA